jgi:hypothetical protein
MHFAERLLLGAVGLGVAIAFAVAAGGAAAPPFGEDAAFWGARAVHLAHGELVGEHPPLYPALAAGLRLVTGLPTVRLAQVLAVLAGAALPVAMAALAGELGGRAAARWAGWLTLGLPALLAWSVRVEPTSVLALSTILVAIGLARVVRQGAASPDGWTRRVVVLGVAAGALAGFKETGAVIGAALLAAFAAAVIPAWGARGVRVSAAAGLGYAVAVAGFVLFAMVFRPPGGVGGRVVMPLDQSVHLILDGKAIAALASPDVPPGWVPQVVRDALTAGSTATRALGFVALQAVRTAVMAGPWVLAAVATILLAGRPGDRFARVLPVALLATAAPLLAVVFQARHLEIALLGAVLGVALALAERPRWVGALVLASVIGWSGVRISSIELERARFSARCATQQGAALERVPTALPAGATLCSVEPWVRVLGEAPIPECAALPDAWRIESLPGRASLPPGAALLGRTSCTGSLVLVPPR